MKMIIKSLVAVGVLSLSAGAFAGDTAGCAGGGAAVSVNSGGFIVNPFELKCSANVYLQYDPALGSPTGTVASVCAGSKKGNKGFGGTSDGGAVKEQIDIKGDITGTSVAAKAKGCTA